MVAMKIFILKPGLEMPILAGHPWVFSNGIEEADPQIQPGELVEVLAKDGRFLGVGLAGAGSTIKVRMISLEKLATTSGGQAGLDKDFFVGRFLELEKSKKRHLPAGTNAYRVVYADADWLPGLIVDKYDDVVVFQIHTAGMDKLHSEILEALKEAFKPRAIVERSDVDARRKEGIRVLEPVLKYGKLDGDLASFQENGIKFVANVIHGQKTGFFLDQRDARKKVMELAGGKRVLNLFSYTGAFSIYAAMGEAASVTSVDVSESAIEMAKKNFELNSLPSENKDLKYQFICADVFEYLKSASFKAGEYDMIICDPPAFAKGGDKTDQAKRAYTDLNKKCLELLGPGGILISSSCSGRVSLEDFRGFLRIAAGKAGRDVRVLASLGQGFDHTDRLCFTEGTYLKTLVLEII